MPESWFDRMNNSLSRQDAAVLDAMARLSGDPQLRTGLEVLQRVSGYTAAYVRKAPGPLVQKWIEEAKSRRWSKEVPS